MSVRDSLVGEGKVAVFSNQTPNRLTIRVEVKNKEESQHFAGNLDIEPNSTAEVGWMEGWKFQSGDTITVSHPSYRSVSDRVP